MLAIFNPKQPGCGDARCATAEGAASACPTLRQPLTHSAILRVGIRSSWWERRVMIKRWERAGKDIQRGFRILWVNTGVPQVLLQRLFAVESSNTVVAVEGVQPKVCKGDFRLCCCRLSSLSKDRSQRTQGKLIVSKPVTASPDKPFHVFSCNALEGKI